MALRCLGGAFLDLGEPGLGGADPGDPGSLVGEQELRVTPASVLLTDELVRRNPDVFEEHLVDLVAAVDELDRPQRDARGVHLHQDEGDAGLLLGCVGIGAYQQEDPVGVLAERGPGLLAVDDVVVAVAHRRRAQRREVGPGLGFGEPLAPPDVEVGRGGQESLFDFR